MWILQWPDPCFVHQLPCDLYFLTFIYNFVSPCFHYSIDVSTEVVAVGCPITSLVVAEDMSSGLDESQPSWTASSLRFDRW